MLPEMRIIEQEILPRLRERAAVQEAKAQSQLRQWRGEKGVCNLLLSVSGDDIPEMKYLPAYDLKEIHEDIEKMFVSQLRGALTTAFAGGSAVPSVRANIGCGGVNTLLGGVRQTYFPDKMPWLLQHLGAEEMAALTKEDIADSEEIARGLEEMRFMKEMLAGTGVEVYPFDIQGPVDMAHLWLGDEFFYLLYDEPETVHHALELSVECIDYIFRKNLDIIRPRDYLCHYNGLVLPAEKPLKLSEDTSTLINREQLDEFMRPYSAELFRRFGGGYIHYCGDNRHLLPITETIEGSLALNFGNPERHDLPAVMAALGENGKFYYGALPMPLEEQVRAAARNDGTFNLFASASCAKADEQRVLDEFAGWVEKYRIR